MCAPVLRVLVRSGEETKNVDATRGGLPPCSVCSVGEQRVLINHTQLKKKYLTTKDNS